MGDRRLKCSAGSGALGLIFIIRIGFKVFGFGF